MKQRGRATQGFVSRWLLIVAILGALFGFPRPAVAQPTTPSVAGTKWVTLKPNRGAISTITFTTDGQYEETWKKKHHKGTWAATPDNQHIIVTLNDNSVITLNRNADGHLVRADLTYLVYELSTDAVAAPSTAEDTNSPVPAPEHEVATVKLTDDQARAIVLVKGDNAEGTGFLVHRPEGPVVMTNIHVISNNPNLKITTTDGTSLTILSYRGATDRDLAMISIKDGPYKYLDVATDAASTAQPGDEVVTPGNSDGGEVMLNTDGKVLGVGPDRIEFDNPIYHGNSGGPVFHVKSGKVIGIVTMAMKVDTTDALNKASFANRNSAIGRSMRYFGFRLDNVPGWETFDLRRFLNETRFLDQFDERSRALDSYLNAPDDNKPEDNEWRNDKDIVKDNDEFFAQSAGADIGQQVNADRVTWSEFTDIAGTEMDQIQNPDNFYSFDRLRATDEITYRKGIQQELTQIDADASQLASLPRTNQH